MQSTAHTDFGSGGLNAPKVKLPQEDGRSIVTYNFEDGGFLRIVVGGNVTTEDALEMAETQIAIKRKELARRISKTEVDPREAPLEPEEGENNA